MTENPHIPGRPHRVSLDELIDRARSAEELGKIAAEHPSVKNQVEIQAQINDALNRLFDDSGIPVVLPRAAKPSRSRWLPWAAAAALLLAGAGIWWFLLKPNGPDVLTPAYREVVAAGFKPETVCTTDQEFASWCVGYMRQPIYPKAHPDGLEFVGWNKGKVISPISGILLVRVSGKPVIVVMERVDRQTIAPGPSADSELHIFRKRIGDVVLYEVTPNPDPVVLPSLSATKG